MRQRLPIALSLTALVVAVLGVTPVGEAARDQLQLPRNSVGEPQLKQAAVTSIKVKNGSLLVKDFMAGQIPQGPAGPVGARGAGGAGWCERVSGRLHDERGRLGYDQDAHRLVPCGEARARRRGRTRARDHDRRCLDVELHVERDDVDRGCSGGRRDGEHLGPQRRRDLRHHVVARGQSRSWRSLLRDGQRRAHAAHAVVADATPELVAPGVEPDADVRVLFRKSSRVLYVRAPRATRRSARSCGSSPRFTSSTIAGPWRDLRPREHEVELARRPPARGRVRACGRRVRRRGRRAAPASATARARSLT